MHDFREALRAALAQECMGPLRRAQVRHALGKMAAVHAMRRVLLPEAFASQARLYASGLEADEVLLVDRVGEIRDSLDAPEGSAAPLRSELREILRVLPHLQETIAAV